MRISRKVKETEESSSALTAKGSKLAVGWVLRLFIFFWWKAIVHLFLRRRIMEHKHILLSALAVGLGFGFQNWVLRRWNSNHISEGRFVIELLNLIIHQKDNKLRFLDFPYYLSKRIRDLLISVGYVHLCKEVQNSSKHIRNFSQESRAILLSGPAELYQQDLVRALAYYFQSKLLLLDINDFSLKMHNKYGCCRKEPNLKRSITEATLGRVSGLFGSMLPFLPSKGTIRDPLKCTSCFLFDEKLFVQALNEVLVTISETSSIILYIKDVEKVFLQSPRRYNLFHKLIKKLPGSVLIIGSRIYDSEHNCPEVDEQLKMLFPYSIENKPPQNETRLSNWKTKLEQAMKKTQLNEYRNHIAKVLATYNIDCNALNSISDTNIVLLNNHIEQIMASPMFYHMIFAEDSEYRDGNLIITAWSLCHLLTLFQEDEKSGEDNIETRESKKECCGPISVTKKDCAKAIEAPPDNEYEKRIRQEVIPANEIGVTFADIGALEDVKERLEEMVILPLRRPNLFKGGLLKPCRGVLLFGPPGTGKTMLAKAIANEAGASFINVSMSTITSKWYGEDEKNVRALFSLASKISPTIIFIDEVDSMLGHRSRSGEHQVTRKLKNEFMSRWDGLLSKPDEKVLVLAATNRPFDLDDAIVRRFQTRIMVGLPSVESREMILKTLLAKEKHDNINFKELSTMTEGYTGSDLKNLCMTAAFAPVRELIQQENAKKAEKEKMEAEVESSEDASNAIEGEEDQPTLRPLNMEDMRQAKNKVAASFSAEGSMMNELKQWNELYGEGGSRMKEEQLSYFL